MTVINACALQVDHNDKDNSSLHAFNKLWESQFAKDCLLVFSTGRSLKLYNELRVGTVLHAHVIAQGQHDNTLCSTMLSLSCPT